MATLIRQGLPCRVLRCLEIGSGSGYLAAYLALSSGIECEVDAVDVLDQRQVSDGYRFHKLTGTVLPFPPDSFDVVISNHVIEHVGGSAEQLEHLREIARVIRPDGLAYLASPSRWQVVEPHYRLAFLSWLPRPLRSPYLRRFRGVPFYDCEPLDCTEIEGLIRAAGLFSRRAVSDALRSLKDSAQHRSMLVRVVSCFPGSLIRVLSRASPTHVYLAARSPERVLG